MKNPRVTKLAALTLAASLTLSLAACGKEDASSPVAGSGTSANAGTTQEEEIPVILEKDHPWYDLADDFELSDDAQAFYGDEGRRGIETAVAALYDFNTATPVIYKDEDGFLLKTEGLEAIEKWAAPDWIEHIGTEDEPIFSDGGDLPAGEQQGVEQAFPQIRTLREKSEDDLAKEGDDGEKYKVSYSHFEFPIYYEEEGKEGVGYVDEVTVPPEALAFEKTPEMEYDEERGEYFLTFKFQTPINFIDDTVIGGGQGSEPAEAQFLQDREVRVVLLGEHTWAIDRIYEGLNLYEIED